jgi:hypothetical protein
VSPAIQHRADVERLAVVLQQIESLADRLHDAKLDPIVDELHEVARAGRSGMDIGAIRRQRAHRVALAADHKAGAVASTVDAAGRSHIDELDASCPKSAIAADRVAPIGVTPIGDNVAGLGSAASR